VREIYRLGRKHGMKLAGISGVNGPFSDAEHSPGCGKLALACKRETHAHARKAGTAKRTVARKRKASPSAKAS